MFKVGDRVILDLHTYCGRCFIDPNDHNKEFRIIEVYSPNKYYGVWDYSIWRKESGVWYVMAQMLKLADPQLTFDWYK